MRSCEWCGEEFLPAYKAQAYCSKPCGREGRRAKMRRPRGGQRTVVCANAECGRQFQRYASQLSKGSNYCSRECQKAMPHPVMSVAGRKSVREKNRNRKGTANPNYRHGRRAGQRDRAGEAVWYAAGERECRHPSCPGQRDVLALHHVVYRQEVERVGGEVWDPRNSLTLCDGCHSSHHRRGSRIVPLSVLRDENYEYAAELLGREAAYEYLRRRYVGEDPRLNALLYPEDAAAMAGER